MQANTIKRLDCSGRWLALPADVHTYKLLLLPFNSHLSR